MHKARVKYVQEGRVSYMHKGRVSYVPIGQVIDRVRYVNELFNKLRRVGLGID